jgi:hypothetical protein
MSNQQNRGLGNEINKLDEAVQKSTHLDAYPLWVRLVGALSRIADVFDELVVALRGDEDSASGILDRLKTVEDAIKPMQSDMRFIKRLLMQQAGYDLDSEPLEVPKKYTSEDHPGRRANDNKSTFDKVIAYFIRYILPPLITWGIIGFILFTIAVHDRILIFGN